MNKICRVKPDYNRCCCCIDDAVDYGHTVDCEKCISKCPECELLHVGVTFFGKEYAFVLMDGKIKKVDLDRICEVREKGD